jgi:predicted polyphosphate/ATP-dependent NAD kinase
MNEYPLKNPVVDFCTELIGRHKPVHSGDEQLINAIITDIRIALSPGGTVGHAENTMNNATDFAIICIQRIQMRTALNYGESDLLEAMANDIKIAFGLEGAVTRSTLPRTSQAPDDWFWQ